MGGFLGSACKMRRLDANGAVQPLAMGVAHQHVLSAKGPFGKTPQRHKAHGSICANSAHHAAHLVAMSVHHHTRANAVTIKLHAVRHNQAITQRVFFHRGPSVAKVANHIDDLILKTRRTLGIGEALEQPNHLVAIDLHCCPFNKTTPAGLRRRRSSMQTLLVNVP